MVLAQPQSQAFHELSSSEIINSFKSNLEVGLTAEEVADRYEIYGWNQLPTHPGKPASKLLLKELIISELESS
ncbi:MAG: cation-transporting P-type ATPase, partial [Cyanobacteria bacterium J06636_16]